MLLWLYLEKGSLTERSIRLALLNGNIDTILDTLQHTRYLRPNK